MTEGTVGSLRARIAAWNQRLETWCDLPSDHDDCESVIEMICDVQDEMSQALALLDAEPQAEGWQPIETAPKDGTLVLLFPSRCWCEEVNSDCEVGYWDDDAQQWLSSAHVAADDWDGHTHWRPLPAPPLKGGEAHDR